jgi:hypothetical protein
MADLDKQIPISTPVAVNSAVQPATIPMKASEQSILEQALALVNENSPAVGSGDPLLPKEVTTVAPTSEKPAEVKPVENSEGPASRGWAAVKEQEKRLRSERDELRKMQQEFKLMQQEMEKAKGNQGDYLKRIKDNPFEVLQEAGLSFEDLANRVLQDGQPGLKEVERKALSEVEELKKQIGELKQTMTTKEAQQFDNQYKDQTAHLLKTDPKYKLLNSYGKAQEDIFELACLHATQTGEFLTTEKAADMILEEYKQELRNTYSHEAVRELFASTATKETDQILPKAQLAATSGKTITTQMAAPHSERPKELGKLSEYEELMEALKLVPKESPKT